MTPELEDSNQRVKSIIFQANLKLFGVTGMKTHIVSNVFCSSLPINPGLAELVPLLSISRKILADKRTSSIYLIAQMR